jgi:hypothetical protein
MRLMAAALKCGDVERWFANARRRDHRAARPSAFAASNVIAPPAGRTWASKLCERIEARYSAAADGERRTTKLADRLAESLKKVDEDGDVDTEDATRPPAKP